MRPTAFVLPGFAIKNYQVVWWFMVGLYVLAAAIVTLVARPKRDDLLLPTPVREGSSDRADDAEDRAEKRADSERAEGSNGARKIRAMRPGQCRCDRAAVRISRIPCRGS